MASQQSPCHSGALLPLATSRRIRSSSGSMRNRRHGTATSRAVASQHTSHRAPMQPHFGILRWSRSPGKQRMARVEGPPDPKCPRTAFALYGTQEPANAAISIRPLRAASFTISTPTPAGPFFKPEHPVPDSMSRWRIWRNFERIVFAATRRRRARQTRLSSRPGPRTVRHSSR